VTGSMPTVIKNSFCEILINKQISGPRDERNSKVESRKKIVMFAKDVINKLSNRYFFLVLALRLFQESFQV
jgi:hypothetical protein